MTQYLSAKQREHEMNIALINAFAQDPSLKHWVAASAGMGVTWVTAMLGQYNYAGQVEETPVDQSINWYETILGAGSPLLSAAGIFDFNKDGEGGLTGNLLAFATGSYTAYNMVCGLMYAMNSGEGQNPLSSLIPVV